MSTAEKYVTAAYLVVLAVPLHMSALVAGPAIVYAAAADENGSFRRSSALIIGGAWLIAMGVGTVAAVPTIAGVIDTKELLKAISKLDAFTSAARIDDLGGKVGDIHAAVFVGERSGLIRSAVVTMSVEAQGKKAELELTYRLRSTNKAVAGL